MKRFTIEIQGMHTLTADEIWPDGDAPENPTSEDVWEKIIGLAGRYREAEYLIREWDLGCDVGIWESGPTED